MPILVMCSNPDCGEFYDVPNDSGGGKVQCPSCGTLVEAPLSETTDEAATGAEMDLSTKEASASGTATIGQAMSAPSLDPPGSAEAVIDLTPDDKQYAASGAVATPKEPIPVSPPPVEEDVDFSQVEDRDAPGETGMRSALLDAVTDDDFDRDDDDTWGDDAEGDELGLVAGDKTENGVDKTLEHRWVVGTMMLVGMFGIAGGALIGMLCYPDQMIFAAFVGGCLGWVAFFTLSFLLVLSNEREEEARVQCTVCFRVFPVGTQTCRLCGAPLQNTGVGPLVAEFRDAASYAFRDRGAIFLMAVLLMIARVAFDVCNLLKEWVKTESWAPSWSSHVLTGVSVFVGFLVFATWADYLLRALYRTLTMPSSPPMRPRFGSLDGLVTGFKALGVLAVYFVPLFTIPLLPLALLYLGARRGKGSPLLNPIRLSRIILDHTRDFVILWLWVMLWGAAMIFGTMVARVICQLSELVPSYQDFSGVALKMLFKAIEMALIGAVACVTSLVICRCIGVFGRKNADTLLPRK